jgi:hypothetical protein
MAAHHAPECALRNEQASPAPAMARACGQAPVVAATTAPAAADEHGGREKQSTEATREATTTMTMTSVVMVTATMTTATTQHAGSPTPERR